MSKENSNIFISVFVSLFFIMPVQAKSTQTYSIIYDLQDASGNKIAQVKYKNKRFYF